MKELKDAVIVAYGRSPITRSGKGGLKNIESIDFSAQVLKGVLRHIPQLDPNEIDNVYVGCAAPILKQGLNIGKAVLHRSELPDSIPAQTISVFCCSGLQSVATGANSIMTGESDVVVCGGIESLTTVPMTSVTPDEFNSWLVENRKAVYAPTIFSVGEKIVKKYSITREEMEKFSAESHWKAAVAQSEGKFVREIIPITTKDDDGNEVVIRRDDGIRENTTLEKLATLEPLIKNGTITAAMASQISDGAAFIVMMSREKAEALGLKPIAKFVSYVLTGVPVEYTGDGPIAAIPLVMKKSGLTLNDMDTIELNEAFASMMVSTIKTLGLDESKINPNGGAIALGHPLGATGSILVCKILNHLENTHGKYGLISMCGAGGHGAAAIIEML